MEDISKNINEEKLFLDLSKEIYDINAVVATTYKFTQNCYLRVDVISKDRIGVYIKLKPNVNISLEQLADEFCNELIDQQLRVTIEKKQENVKELIVKKAFMPIEDIK